ncbi:MAG TPA: sugar ABC transporter permease [Vicinamibacteria bacterium]|nr:sugar ABC transporter permease [Vicinamibacteria bacterium]
MRPSRERIVLLLPAMAYVAVVVLVPALRVIQLSFTEVELRAGLQARWAGLAPFVRLWQDGRWWAALNNTIVFTSASVFLETALGLGFALVLHQRMRGRRLLRAAVLLPWALPTAVMALGWAWIFNDSFGVANDVLRRAGLISRPLAWLADPVLAMVALVVADVWKTTPFSALVVLAGLQGIPESLLEAARVDGLDAWQRFRHVVWPLLVPSMVVAVLFRAVQAYGAFDVVYVMTGGGPGGATETVSLYAFQNDFRYLDPGYGSAIAVQGMLLVFAAAALGLRAVRRPA